jgi:hypothetical protein
MAYGNRNTNYTSNYRRDNNVPEQRPPKPKAPPQMRTWTLTDGRSVSIDKRSVRTFLESKDDKGVLLIGLSISGAKMFPIKATHAEFAAWLGSFIEK